jgi:hypothetical protein
LLISRAIPIGMNDQGWLATTDGLDRR